MAVLRVCLFGGVMVSWDGAPLPPIGGTVARSLFAFLLTYRERPHTRDLLAGTFWPDLPDDLARRRLSQGLWRIRKALEPHPVLVTEGDTVQINPDLPLWLDIEQFAKRSAQCLRDDAAEPEVIDLCRSCLELVRGDFLTGYYADWILPERERLREQYLGVLEQLVASHKRRGDYAAALVHARRLAGEDLLREEAHREVMRLCHLLGRDAEALRQFETCRQALIEELGVEPAPATVALAREIAGRGGQAPPLDLAPAPPPAAAFAFDARVPELPLVGREAERAEVLAHVEALLQGLGGVVFVEGEVGVGKTRFLRAIARDAEWRGAEVLWAGARQAEATTPYGPLVQALDGGLSALRSSQLAQILDEIWLQALAALLPSLASALPALSPPPALAPAQEQDRLANALAQFLAGWAQIVPLLLVLEDLHWAGQDTLDLLARLAPSLIEGGVLVLASYRGEEARALPETWQKLVALDRAGVRQRLVLNRLSAVATSELTHRSLGLGNTAPAFDARLFRETAGNPLFLLETLRALHAEGALVRDEGGRWTTPWDDPATEPGRLPVPSAVEQIVARRLDALTLPQRQVLHLAAVLGEEFDFNLLRTAGGTEPAGLLASLRELVQHRFLDETDRGYCFHHDKIRQVVYADIEDVDRPRLHRWVAQAMEHLHPGQVATLAHHWTAGEVWDRAADSHRQAGDGAAAVFAHAEAKAHYTRALDALGRLPEAPDEALLFELRSARGSIHGLMGERQAQAQDLAAMDDLADKLDDNRRRAQVAMLRGTAAEEMADYEAAIAAAQSLLQLSHEMQEEGIEATGQRQWGTALWRQGKYQDALDRLHRALALARSADSIREEAASLYALAAVARHTASAPSAQSHGRQALSLYRELGDRQGEAASLNLLGVLAHLAGDFGAATDYYEQALHTRRLIGDLPGQAVSTSNLGVIHLTGGDYARALDCYQESLRVSRMTGDRLHQADSLGNRGLVFLQLGIYAQARISLEESLGLYREIGSRRGECSRLADLALLFHHLGDAEEALDLAQQALSIAQELGNRFREAEAWQVLGDARSDLGNLDGAAAAYQQALVLFGDLGQSNYALDALARQAQVSLAQGDLAGALEQVEQFLGHQDAGTVKFSHEPLVAYWACYRVLMAANDPRAFEILASAHRLLQRRATRIPDPEMRRAYLKNVAVHKGISTAYRASQAGEQREVRLPRAGAPIGRPLRDDEYVPVTWTVTAPEDEALNAGPDRRQARLLRLLAEAADQGAAPTVGDLAGALGVSEPTVRRDLAALRRAGHDVQTRGSRRGRRTS